MDRRSLRGTVSLSEVESEADFILYSEQEGVISEHCTQSEARVAFFQQARNAHLGDYLPRIYRRGERDAWVPFSWQ